MLKNIFLCILALTISSCALMSMKDPEVKITKVDVANVSAQDITLNLGLNIDNPNSTPLKLDQVTYAIQFSGQELTEGVVDQGINIPANGQGQVVVPLKFKFSMLDSLVSGFMKKTLTKEYTLKGTAKLGILSIPFSKTGQVEIK